MLMHSPAKNLGPIDLCLNFTKKVRRCNTQKLLTKQRASCMKSLAYNILNVDFVKSLNTCKRLLIELLALPQYRTF